MAYTLVPSDIARVHDIIRPYVRQTPVLHANGSDVGLEPFPLSLKLEFLQHTGSFKPRGAFTNMLTLSVPPALVAAASGGNHGVAVAYAAMRRGVLVEALKGGRRMRRRLSRRVSRISCRSVDVDDGAIVLA